MKQKNDLQLCVCPSQITMVSSSRTCTSRVLTKQQQHMYACDHMTHSYNQLIPFYFRIFGLIKEVDHQLQLTYGPCSKDTLHACIMFSVWLLHCVHQCSYSILQLATYPKHNSCYSYHISLHKVMNYRQFMIQNIPLCDLLYYKVVNNSTNCII